MSPFTIGSCRVSNTHRYMAVFIGRGNGGVKNGLSCRCGSAAAIAFVRCWCMVYIET